ncbi:polysaccharide pyruvyl transferase family protein [Tetragenococcus halophilus]|uniref:polysaccharide pyruvyl transferase family protein n=1 Tax=Tetragenococcus halophilus TaxID=51669 RepID=UPI0033900CC6
MNAKSWIDFLKKPDLAVGSRLHGNITATIAGTPSLLIPKDARMRVKLTFGMPIAVGLFQKMRG